MMRLHFTPADLRAVTVLAPDPLEEAVLSVRHLRTGPTGGRRRRPGLDRWHRHRAAVTARAGILGDLVLAEGFLPDFLFQASDDFDSAVAMAVETPTEQLAAEIAQLPASKHAGHQLRDLAEGTAQARQHLAKDLRNYFGSCLADLWPQIRANAAADRALRAETLLRGGVDGLLATLGPGWRWDPPTLHIPWPGSIEVPLCGHGLVLVPSYFGGPALMYRTDEPTVLVYPLHAGEAATLGADALGPLLGRTRAAVLAAARHPATTTAVAERAGISLPSASQHTAVLRNAGLLTTTRTGSAVLHALSPLGEALLYGDTATG
ncbi:winged helix-turn-helix domain-containing protein [Streptomyces sp. NPDC004675]|uniref:ArsR/SmtB family transcription factor n=1 Tax=Streptomyces sp. NPDC004675 TaxID=3154286 RepID=UPI0033B91575